MKYRKISKTRLILNFMIFILIIQICNLSAICEPELNPDEELFIFDKIVGIGNIYQIQYSPKGDIIVAYCADRTMKIFNSTSLEIKHTIIDENPGRYYEEDVSMSFSNVGDYLVTSIKRRFEYNHRPDFYSFETKVWDTRNWQLVKTFINETGNSIYFFPNDTHMISGISNNELKVYNVSTWDIVHNITIMYGGLSCLSNNGKYLAIVNEDSNIEIMNTANWSVIKEIELNYYYWEGITKLIFSQNGKYLACYVDVIIGEIIIWNTTTWEIEREWNDRTSSFCFSSDESLFIYSSHDHIDENYRLDIRNINNWEIVYTLILHPGKNNQISFLKNGREFVYNIDDNFNVFDVDKLKIIKQKMGINAYFHRSCVSNKENLLTSYMSNGNISIWNISTWECKNILSSSIFINTLTYSPDDSLFATGDDEGNITIYDTKTWEILNQYKAHHGIYSLYFSQDGKHLAANAGVKSYLINIESMECIKIFEGKSENNLRFSPDGNLLLHTEYSYSSDALIFNFLDTSTWELSFVYSFKTYNIHSNYFSPNGSLLVSYHPDVTDIYKITGDNNLEKINSIYGVYSPIKFSPNGRFIITDSRDSVLKIWDTYDWSCIQRIDEAGPIFSPDGNTLITAIDGKTKRIWKLNPIYSNDYDNDNIVDLMDLDDDNDNFLDEWEEFLDTSPLNPEEHPLDTDNDGEPDGDFTNSKAWMDLDDDNDGYLDDEDTYPKDPNKWKKEEEKGFIPGFEFLFFIISLLILLLFKKKFS